MFILSLGLVLVSVVSGLKYDPQYEGYNLNENDTDNPLEYWGKWEDHDFYPSPENWRLPFYTLFLDRFVNGDPSNDNINETHFEQDILGTQLRFGGDIDGLADTLDYIQGFGIKAIYVAGSPFINQPWGADSYSPLDLTLLDMHFGNITQWRAAVTEIHRRGMYIILDNTLATMGDLIGFENYLNESAPFWLEEHPALWKTSRHYHDFTYGTEYNETCDMPRFYLDDGEEVDQDVYDQFGGCYDGDFDQFGDTEAFGVYPDWRRQITKFASVQDRLREWVPSVLDKLSHFSCITIASLDIDGFRYDKATQVTVDAEGNFSSHLRECARELGKNNFFIPGEITGGNGFGSIYVGRGRQPSQYLENIEVAVNLTNATTKDIFIRDEGQEALDGAAFHYSIYRNLLRFLGMDGSVEAAYDLPKNWVEAWNTMLTTNDFLNANTGKFDPRHMYGVVNQDVFRWPALTLGIERNLLGLFITTLHMPGIPLLLWGEEQAYYVHDNTASNYMYGRQPISSSQAWQRHGCYSLEATLYYQMPLDAALTGCEDDTVSYDHRDPSHPVRAIIKHMYHLREQFPVLKDGFYLRELSAQTKEVTLPGSSGTPTEFGIWSVMRSEFLGIQDLGNGTSATPVWLLYHNNNVTTTYSFDCTSDDLNKTLIAPFDTNTKVRNLMFPHQRLNLTDSATKLEINGSTEYNGCVDTITMNAYEFRAYVPEASWIPPPPMITKYYPGHDFRIKSSESTTVSISFHASTVMDCDSFTDAISFSSKTLDSSVTPSVDSSTVKCENISETTASYPGAIASAWSWSADVVDLAPGIHQIIVTNASTADLGSFTNSVDRFLIRVGAGDNPLVFQTTSNYSTTLLSKSDSSDGDFILNHTAAGADQFRYSLTWESSWSDWMEYPDSQKSTIKSQSWSGTKSQEWDGEHVIVQYYSKLLGSSAYVQHGDLDYDTPRRFPHLHTSGPFNQYGYDAGLNNVVKQHSVASTWDWHYMDEWYPSAHIQLSVWGMNPDGQPDQSFVYGDIDGDYVLERLPPSSLVESSINITQAPPKPYLSYRIVLQDSTLRYQLQPQGNMYAQLALYILLWIVPIISGLAVVFVFKRSFYKVKFNEFGTHDQSKFGLLVQKTRHKLMGVAGSVPLKTFSSSHLNLAAAEIAAPTKRRTVLIATMEYNIDDWAIKIKIGGLGVMSQLMGSACKHQDLIWVVPCVGGIDYPIDEPAESMLVKIMDQFYEIQVQYHKVDNITFVLLDAPVFRKQSKAEPYPARMDDMESAIYYSAWNQCIAETINRFPVDLYHINDYHGAAALLYLLPKTLPAAMSLHNAEFQGMWPMRTPEESMEVCKVYNLPLEVVREYVQFGSVFNLLNAGASYLRINQGGFGAVGVSKKYGDRSYARYPIFWGLSKIGELPNPDPSDTGEWNKDDCLKEGKLEVDETFEAGRAELKRQAQEWAGLTQNPDAELMVFVGRWSLQKGVDLIADIFPWVLEHYPQTQLICVGPVIDLYGRFAALKLSKLMEQFPGRVFSKPEFTALPPYIFSGAEFALIPSRDEPFGLVAVEFGRKGALGIGGRVGGLGTMPGWWFTVESTKASHLLSQFKHAIVAALETDRPTRALMRAAAAKQRFPVAQWLQKLDKLQSSVIRVHHKNEKKSTKKALALLKNSQNNGSSMALTSDVTTTYADVSQIDVRQIPDHDDDYTLGDYSRNPSGLNTPMMVSRPSSPGLTPRLGSPMSSRPGTPGQSFFNSHDRHDSEMSFPDQWPMGSDLGLERPRGLGIHDNSSRASMLSLDEVVGDRNDFKLQKVDPFFTDQKGDFYSAFEKKLGALTVDNSISELCIEDYLIKSEKEWFEQYRDARLGRSASPSPSVGGRPSSPARSKLRVPAAGGSRPRLPSALMNSSTRVSLDQESDDDMADQRSQFAIPDDYVPPTGLKKYLQYSVGDWPIYSILLAMNQVLSVNSYQVTLLTGEVGQAATKLYTVASIYLVFAILWYTLSRTVPLLYPLAIPFFVYGIAFIILGFSPMASDSDTKGWLQNVATGFYAAASASGAISFAFNFGTDGGSTVTTWIFRMAVIQGLSQLYTIGLWAWGSLISAASANSTASPSLANSPALLGVCLPITLLLWAIGVVVFLGLPDFYRETPGPVPQLWKTLLKRKTIAWYLLAVLIQNYFLSTLYGRNWFFLFSSKVLPVWGVVLLALGFFTIGWAGILYALAVASKSHPWLFPMFAVGLGAPRWAQMFWGTSRIGLWLPWAGGAMASAVLSRMLWLWLGLLDAVSGAGIGVILMLTLTRVHVSAAVASASVLGSIATMLARATAPNNLGPGDVFPDMSKGVSALGTAWFWVVLFLQLFICIGYFKFFRKEQVSKP
ncbi:alpha-1,3-glucan synthase [Pseudomassariella vexata]|uniref:alpha-1,3-glucan synthase n=1 Tax=Pseudomassariella vexata TaxID=1141098 RepID=A0A1Y2D5Y0_9PEZI|nr:alpha-1,3-glucan synthase [Pseudomassariella vexata]ORY54718.1 alpha-1,3-glucan synthase [Pseudomassariella vexata]